MEEFLYKVFIDRVWKENKEHKSTMERDRKVVKNIYVCPESQIVAHLCISLIHTFIISYIESSLKVGILINWIEFATYEIMKAKHKWENFFREEKFLL
jgi:hypothetical protein